MGPAGERLICQSEVHSGRGQINYTAIAGVVECTSSPNGEETTVAWQKQVPQISCGGYAFDIVPDIGRTGKNTHTDCQR